MYGDLPEYSDILEDSDYPEYSVIPEGLPPPPLADLDFGPSPVGVYDPHDIVDLPMGDMDPRDDYLQQSEYGTIPPGTSFEDYYGNGGSPDWVVDAADEAYNSVIEGTDELQDALGDFLGF